MRHVNMDLVLMVAQGLLPPRVLAIQMVEHLKELCPECGASLAVLGSVHQAFIETRAQQPAAPDGDRPDPRYTSLVSKAGRELVEWARRLDGERRAAETDLRMLLRLPRKERRTRIVRARTHFLSRSFVELLIEHAWRLAPTSPEESAELARLVPVVLDRIPGVGTADWAEELRIRAQAHVANALRIAGELPEADRLFLEIRRALAKVVNNSVELHAEVSSLEASLRLNQRRLEEAERLLDRAVLLYREQRDQQALARVLVKRGAVHQAAGNLAQAAEDLTRALEAPASDDEGARVRVCAVSNLALCLCDLGRCSEARELVDRNRSLYRASIGAWESMRLPWLEGIIARGLGEVGTAERLFLDARNRFVEKGRAFDAALVSIDLALVYVDQNRPAELRRVSRLIEPILRTRGLHRETTAALILFQRAAAASLLSRESLLDLRLFVEESRRNPRLRFEAPPSWRSS